MRSRYRNLVFANGTTILLPLASVCLKMRLLSLFRAFTLVAAIFVLLGEDTSLAYAQDCVEPPLGLISWWPGDGNATDIRGGNDGTMQNGATFAPGKVGQAFSFDGIDALFEAGTDNLPTGSSDRTLELWVKINSLAPAGEERWFAGYGNFGSWNQVYSLGTLLRGSSQENRVFFSPWGGAIAGPVLSTGTWYHIAATNVGNFVTLYLDGAPVGVGTLPLETPADTRFFIGRIEGRWGDIRRLDGSVDEVSIYDRALSEVEIRSIYEAGSAGKCKGGFRGDMNCDDAFNGADIDPFFLALGDPAAYAAQFPNCDILNGDMNRDGRLDGGDIDPFFACLGGGACP